MGMMWRIGSWLYTYKTVDEKLMIFPNHLFLIQTQKNEGKIKLSIALQIYNCSNEIISCIIDEEKKINCWWKDKS